MLKAKVSYGKFNFYHKLKYILLASLFKAKKQEDLVAKQYISKILTVVLTVWNE